MGRAAVHSGKIITWEEMFASNFQFCPNIDSMDYDTAPPLKPDANGRYPVPVPGELEEDIYSQMANTAGRAAHAFSDSYMLEWNDLAALDQLFSRYGVDIAEKTPAAQMLQKGAIEQRLPVGPLQTGEIFKIIRRVTQGLQILNGLREPARNGIRPTKRGLAKRDMKSRLQVRQSLLPVRVGHCQLVQVGQQRQRLGVGPQWVWLRPWATSLRSTAIAFAVMPWRGGTRRRGCCS